MSKSDQLEKRWDAMSEDEKCLAYGRAVLADARHRDSIFKRERNEANTLYDMKVTFAYGGGKR